MKQNLVDCASLLQTDGEMIIDLVSQVSRQRLPVKKC